MREALIQSQIMAVLNHRDSPCRVWRNNVGYATDTHVRYGLGVGSADLVGLVTKGPSRGQFLAVEVKTPVGRLSDEQKAWLDIVQKLGGLTFVWRSAAEAEEFVRRLNAS